MNRIFSLAAFALFAISANAQQVLSLDSCRAMALRNNKQLNVTKIKQDAAENTRKAMRTKYLPKVDALGGYEYFSKEVSLLSQEKQTAFANLGSNAMGKVGANAGETLTNMAMAGLISPQTAKEMGNILSTLGQPIAQYGDQLGQSINDALRTDTRNIWSGALMVRQPIYMGGAIIAANRMADIAEQMTRTEYEGQIQSTLSNIDETYWLVVSLKQKQKLANSFCDLLTKLNEDVHKLIREGMATKSDGLKVDVKVNEAEMAVTKVEDGLSLARMLLCQQIGLPLDSDITLADEDNDALVLVDETASLSGVNPADNRSELKLLQNAVELSKEARKLVRAPYLPQVALTGGYLISNPNCFNGFENKFAGVWNVGVVVRVPVWNWMEGVYKVKASKAATAIASMELSDAQEKINLQVEQSRYKVKEALKHLEMARKNVANAEENLRCANIGFREGVIETTEVMAAQTAWQSAQAMIIDAQIEVKLTQVNLKKALGVLN